ncbi:MAG: hypothetical protein ACK5RJ_04750 [Burkholderiales bacterium]|jgi:hypothetical protein|nr:hypothetical protein [Rhodocyclaceae bacterium]MCA3022690.1 hypothetical protein [Rhodocyclaceae bacterium]MCA3053493.1 hypothetical protein [Rhodocyclaceae bacterium]MCA3056211.1 hypothetical protein [Rhodocyclaceae bacterium]
MFAHLRPRAAVRERLLISYIDPAYQLKNKLTLTLWLMLLCSSAISAECVKDPVQQTKTLFAKGYFFYAWSMPEVMEAIAPQLSDALKREFHCKSKGELCAMGADPWLSAQDGEASPPHVFRQTKRNGKVVVEFSYQFTVDSANVRTQSVTLWFSKTKRGCWLMEDFESPDGNSMLRHLNEWHAKPQPKR